MSFIMTFVNVSELYVCQPQMYVVCCLTSQSVSVSVSVSVSATSRKT